MKTQISEILRFDIPDASNDFREYVFELCSKYDLSTDILHNVLGSLVDISLGLVKDIDSRLISEVAHWESLGYNSTEMNFIFYKSILDVAYNRMEMIIMSHEETKERLLTN